MPTFGFCSVAYAGEGAQARLEKWVSRAIQGPWMALVEANPYERRSEFAVWFEAGRPGCRASSFAR